MKAIRFMPWLISGIPVILCAWLIIDDQTLRYGFERIKIGMSSAEVMAMLGTPHRIDRCGTWGGDPAINCQREFSYVTLLEFPDVWVVSLDTSDRVSRTLRYRSP